MEHEIASANVKRARLYLCFIVFSFIGMDRVNFIRFMSFLSISVCLYPITKTFLSLLKRNFILFSLGGFSTLGIFTMNQTKVLEVYEHMKIFCYIWF